MVLLYMTGAGHPGRRKTWCRLLADTRDRVADRRFDERLRRCGVHDHVRAFDDLADDAASRP